MFTSGETKWIAEVRVGGEWSKLNVCSGGTWESLKDEFGVEQVFDTWREAHEALKTKCPEVKMYGTSVGRVRDVVMIDRRK